MPPEAAEAWYPLLADLDGQMVMAAVNACALDPAATWPPSLGAIRQAASPPEPSWEQALERLREVVNAAGGSYGCPPETCGDPALDDVIAGYGWRAVCEMNPADPTARAQFRDSYRAAQTRLREQASQHVAARAVEAGSRKALGAG